MKALGSPTAFRRLYRESLAVQLRVGYRAGIQAVLPLAVTAEARPESVVSLQRVAGMARTTQYKFTA